MGGRIIKIDQRNARVIVENTWFRLMEHRVLCASAAGYCSGCHGDQCKHDDVTGSEVRMLQYDVRDDMRR